MNSGLFLFGAVVGAYGEAITFNFFDKKRASIARACKLVNNKGMINLGAGCQRSAFAEYVCNLEFVKANIDLVDGGTRMLLTDLELAFLPFEDKEFDVAYASHVLEHLKNWQRALDEWCRIADHVIVVVPHPLSIGGRLNPDHWQHFSFSDLDYVEQNWPTVQVFA